MKYANNRYIDGSSAKKIIYNENNELRKHSDLIVKKKSKSDVMFFFIIIVAVFSMLMVLVYRYTMLTEINFNYYEKYRLYNNFKTENNKIRADIQSSINLDEIRKKAEDMGLIQPDSNQVLYIDKE